MSFLGEETLTRIRFEPAEYVAGRAVEGDSDETDFLGSVQPMREKDRQVLPEGARMSDARKIYCLRGTLRVDDQHTGDAADQVLIGGSPFTVVHVDASHPLIMHDRAYVLREREAE